MDWSEHFAGKAAVVTGAAGVIGRFLVEGCLAAGMKVMASDRDAAALADLAGQGCATHLTELTEAASIEALVAATADAFGAPDLVVNNAGVYPSGFLLDIPAAEWDRIMDVNLRAPFLVSAGFAKAMIAAGKGGSIINISSGASRKMRRSVVPYCVSKTALDRLTKGFALELAEFGIRVNAVEPGFAPGSTASPLTDEHVAGTLAQIPLGRGTSREDVVNAVLFAASPLAGYMTGGTITVDGGNSIGSLAVYQAKKRPL